MTVFQLLMLGASAFFAYKIYEHIQTLQEPKNNNENEENAETQERTQNSFSTSTAASLMQKADQEREKGNLDMALAIYSEANIKAPLSAETLFKMAYTLVLQERDEEALEYFKESLDVDTDNPFAHLEMAKIYIKNAENASAKTHLNAALELEPDLEEAQEALEKLNAGN